MVAFHVCTSWAEPPYACSTNEIVLVDVLGLPRHSNGWHRRPAKLGCIRELLSRNEDSLITRLWLITQSTNQRLLLCLYSSFDVRGTAYIVAELASVREMMVLRRACASAIRAIRKPITLHSVLLKEFRTVFVLFLFNLNKKKCLGLIWKCLWLCICKYICFRNHCVVTHSKQSS